MSLDSAILLKGTYWNGIIDRAVKVQWYFPLLVILQPLLWKALGGARVSRAGDTEALLAERFAMKTSNVLRKE